MTDIQETPNTLAAHGNTWADAIDNINAAIKAVNNLNDLHNLEEYREALELLKKAKTQIVRCY